jgi:hypothetical protein
MSILSEIMRNALADEYAAQAGLVSLHTADPGTTGANELSGGGYARETPAWNAASGGQAQAVVTFDVPISTISHVGIWDAGGTEFLDSYPLSFPVVVTTAGQRNCNLTFTQV